MGETVERFPLFPLGIVLLPSEVVPLHIFEERYKLMIGECLDTEGEFGIVWLSDDGLREVGCTARVSQVLKELEDGRMNVLVAGGRPFRLLRRIDDMPYPAGDVEMLYDAEADADSPESAEAEAELLELASQAHERYADLVEQVTDERPSADDLEDLDAYGMAATIEFEPGPKQELLELRSERERLAQVRDLFVSTMKRIADAEEAGELARSNGRIRFS
jgi:Lon protease-like protein